VDNSDKSPGFKFAEHEMNGIPLRIEIGPRDLENKNFILARRDDYSKETINFEDDILSKIKDTLDKMHNDMFEKAKKRNAEKTYACTSLEEVKNIMNTRPGYVKSMWCGSEECELKMKEINGTKSRCIPFDQEHISDKCICCGKEAKHMVIWGIQY
jgi:prolyl-tRNA synthetase